jgi:hypothetical protein
MVGLLSFANISGWFPLVVLPFFILQLFAMVFLVSVVRPGTRPGEVAKAVYCVAGQFLGILMMTGGGIPLLYGMLMSETMDGGFSTQMNTSLLLLFAAGALTTLLHEQALRRVDPTSRAMPFLLFFMTWRFLGFILCMLGSLSVVFQIILSDGLLPDHWWVSDTLILLVGVLLVLMTRELPAEGKPFASTSMATPTTAAKKRKR